MVGNIMHKVSSLVCSKIYICFIVLVIAFSLLSVCLQSESVGGSDFNNKRLISELESALDAFYRMDFEKSEKIFDKAIMSWSQNPLPYLIKGGYYLEKFRFHKDYTQAEEKQIKDEFFRLNKKVVDLAKERLKDDPADIDATFYLGAAKGNIGRFYIIKQQWWKAIWPGKKGFKLCEKAVAKNPEYYDAYLGTGLYRYIAAVLPDAVKVLSYMFGGPNADKERGIKELNIVRDKNVLLSVEARRILLGVDSWEQNWNSYYANSKWLVEKYPENIWFNVFYIYGLAHNNKIEDARIQLDKVNKIIKDEPDNLSLSIRTKYFRYSGFLDYNIGEYNRAVQSYLKAIELSKEKKPFERIWAEDYYLLASSFAYQSNEDEAFQYLKKAIDEGWERETVLNHPVWKQYYDKPQFVKIIGKSTSK